MGERKISSFLSHLQICISLQFSYELSVKVCGARILHLFVRFLWQW